MIRFGKFVALSTLSAVLCTGAMFAQDNHDQRNNNDQQNRGNGHDQQNNDARHDQGANNHDNHQYVRHTEWKKGARMQQQDWGRGEPVDYRANHLKAPRRGYEWRQVDGNYVMAAVATGLIFSVIAASAAH